MRADIQINENPPAEAGAQGEAEVNEAHRNVRNGDDAEDINEPSIIRSNENK